MLSSQVWALHPARRATVTYTTTHVMTHSRPTKVQQGDRFGLSSLVTYFYGGKCYDLDPYSRKPLAMV